MKHPFMLAAFCIALLCNLTFESKAQQAVLIINEINPNIAAGLDLIELVAISGGSVGAFTVEQAIGTPVVLATLPAVNVAAGDLIVVHINASIAIGSAPGSETVSKNQYTTAQYSANYDNAWDFHGGVTGFTYGYRVVVVRDSSGTIQDAVPFVSSGTSNAAFPSDLQYIQVQNLWLPSDCGGNLCTYSTVPTAQAVSVDWTGVSTSATGNSMQRQFDVDHNDLQDWQLTASTWGALNPGQSLALQVPNRSSATMIQLQNYPNPFSKSTTIQFTLPHSCFVSMKIYDVLGNEVATPVLGRLSAGVHSALWTVRNLAEGIYVCNFQAGDFNQTMKLHLLSGF